MSELKLEVGKSYINRVGDIVKIVSKDKKISWPFVDSDNDTYEEDGTWSTSGSSLDLIKEYIEPTKPKDNPKHNTSYTIDGVTMNIKQKGSKTKLKYGEGYPFSGETAAVLTNTGNGYICKFKAHNCVTQDYYVCLDYGQAQDLYCMLKTVLGDDITEGESNE